MSKSIRRKGVIGVSDAKITIRDETGDAKDWFATSPLLKAQIVLRLTAYLKTQGWTFFVPYDKYTYGENTQASRRHAELHRQGVKDGLEIEIGVSGYVVEIQFWEDVVDHTADNSHGGRYIFDKEKKMPYRQLCRLRATKLKIIKFLTDYHDYKLSDNSDPIFPVRQTAIEFVQGRYDECWHKDGSDIWDASLNKVEPYNAKSATGELIEHGSLIWARGYNGRWVYGIALHNINNMWWVLCGKWGCYNIASFEIHTKRPDNLNVRVSECKATRALNSKIENAVKEKNFLLAHRLQTALDKQYPPAKEQAA